VKQRIDPVPGSQSSGQSTPASPAGWPTNASRLGGVGSAQHRRADDPRPMLTLRLRPPPLLRRATETKAPEAQRREGAAAARPRPRRSSRYGREFAVSSRSAPPTCSGCRRSTPTTATGRQGQGRRCESRPVPARLPTAAVLAPSARREHGELSGGFKSGGRRATGGGQQARPRQLRPAWRCVRPQDYEALTHTYSPDVAEDTCVKSTSPATRWASGSCARHECGRGAGHRARRCGTPTGGHQESLQEIQDNLKSPARPDER